MNATIQVLDPQSTKVKVKFTITNTLGRAVKLCKFHTPLERCKSKHIFRVTAVPDGTTLPYCGIMAERTLSASNDFVTMKNGETISFEQDLGSMCYQCQPGTNYEIAVIAKFTENDCCYTKSNVPLLTVNCAPVQFTCTQ